MAATPMMVHVKLPGHRTGRVISVRVASTESVHGLLARIAAEGGAAAAGEGARLVFAGRALDPRLPLGQCQVVADSELHLVFRGPPPPPLDPYTDLRAALATAQVS